MSLKPHIFAHEFTKRELETKGGHILQSFENWRPIRGFPDYEVSNLGRVKSLSRDYGYGSHGDMILKPDTAKGYKRVTLFRDCVRHRRQVHRLVAEAFIPNPENLPLVNHKDENKANNRVENLEWCTQQYNANYGTRNSRIGERVSRKVVQLTMDGTVVRVWNSMTAAARATGACLSEISTCCKNQKYSAAGYKWRKADEQNQVC